MHIPMTNTHMHLFTIDNTPAIQLYYLVRDILIKVIRKRCLNIRIEKIERMRKVPFVLDILLVVYLSFAAGKVRKALDRFVAFVLTVSNISVNSMTTDRVLGELFDVNKNLSASKIRKFVKKQMGTDKCFRDVIILLVSRLYEINNTSTEKVTQTDTLSSFLESLNAKPIYGRLVVLSMDFDSAFAHVKNPGFLNIVGGIPYNMPRSGFTEQLNELIKLSDSAVLKDIGTKARYQRELEIYPFMCIDPRSYTTSSAMLDAVQQNVEKGVKGIKLYPPLGYLPEDVRLAPLWTYCMEEKIPVLTHCNVGGAGRKGAVNCAELAHPYYWIPVFERLLSDGIDGVFRLCLGHFGTVVEDEIYAWWDEIVDLLLIYKDKQEILIYSDISANYPTRKNAKRFFKHLRKMMLLNPLVRDRILYGSDWWMQLFSITEREYIANMFEKWSHMRNYPCGGADAFMKQLEKNAEKFLGIQ